MLAVFVSSCERESEADNVVIFVTPSATVATGGQKIYFDIAAETINQQIVRLKIESFDSINGETLLYDEEQTSKSLSFRYVYDVPNVDVATLNVELTFTVEDNLGNMQWMRHTLKVESSTTGLDELTGIALYSPHANREDAFSFRLMQRVKSSEAEDTDVDIYVEADGTDENTLGRSWGSKTGLRFCKVNSFNYAAASQHAIESVYNNSITSTRVTDLEVDDVILVGDDGGAIAAIRIVNIYDEEGAALDRYDISMKAPRYTDEDGDDAEDTTPEEGEDVPADEEGKEDATEEK